MCVETDVRIFLRIMFPISKIQSGFPGQKYRKMPCARARGCLVCGARGAGGCGASRCPSGRRMAETVHGASRRPTAWRPAARLGCAGPSHRTRNACCARTKWPVYTSGSRQGRQGAGALGPSERMRPRSADRLLDVGAASSETNLTATTSSRAVPSEPLARRARGAKGSVTRLSLIRGPKGVSTVGCKGTGPWWRRGGASHPECPAPCTGGQGRFAYGERKRDMKTTSHLHWPGGGEDGELGGGWWSLWI